MKTTVLLSARKFRYAWVAFLLVAAITTTGAETNPVISSFQFQAAVVWSNSLAGHSYAVQRASALDTNAWFNVPGFSNVSPTNSVMRVAVPVSGPTGFYRILDNGHCCTNSGGGGPSGAVSLGTICGDSSGDPIIATGCGAAWYRVTVAECVNISDIDLAANITLTHPAAACNLFVYNTSFTQIASASSGASTCVARDDVDGVNRSFDIIIEVRPFGIYGCDNWTLEIRRIINAESCFHLP